MNKIKHYLKNGASKIKLTTPVAVIFSAIIISASIISYGFITRAGISNTKDHQTTAFKGKAVDGSDFITGKADSKVTVIEYSDPECPYCILVSPTMKQLREKYADKVRFVYRAWPLTQIHPHAFDESKAIICAGKVGGAEKHFEYIDALFGYKQPLQSEKNASPQLSATGKEDLARKIGLDVESFKSCMNNPETSNLVNASLVDGQTAGVQGTPSTFVLIKNKKGFDVVSMVDGARQESYFEAAIEEALSK